jgi:hypothetical protein
MGRKRNENLNYVPVIVNLSLEVNGKLEKEQKRQKQDYNRKVNKATLINEVLDEKL